MLTRISRMIHLSVPKSRVADAWTKEGIDMEPLIIEDPSAYQGEFSDLQINVMVAPTRDVLISYNFDLTSSSGKLLLPVPGFKSDFLTVGPFPIPLSVRVEGLDVEVDRMEVLPEDGTQVTTDLSIRRLANGNKGILVSGLPDKRCQITVACTLFGACRADILGTELVLGIFPPWGWNTGTISVQIEGALQAGSTWGQKLVAGVHSLQTGRRRGFLEKYRPANNLLRFFRTGNDLSWKFLTENVLETQEIRLRARASRVPFMAPISPLVVWAVVVIIVLGTLAGWLGGLIAEIIK